VSSVDISEYVRTNTSFAVLSERGFAKQLERFIQTRAGHTIDKVDMAETVLAIIGAVFIDCGLGFAQCIKVMGQLSVSWA
jgi:dsRNA-specific ribonuclease